MTDPIINRLDQIKGRAEKATEGPWEADIGRDEGAIPDVIAFDGVYGVMDKQDAEFIAEARTDVPQMEQALREVLATLDEWRPVDQCTDDLPCADCTFHAELHKAIASALGIETEGGER